MSEHSISFTTPAAPTEAEIVIKKSRFIGQVRPVRSVDEAEVALQEIRAVHKTATHNCYAYTVGLGVPVERFSDDGEPSGTAGRPILEVLRRRGVANTLLVVTRYFGGTLLGANGLVRAYTDASVAALDAADWLNCRLMRRVTVRVDYGRFGKLEYELSQAGYTLREKEFAEDVRLILWADADQVPDLQQHLADWTDGTAAVEVSPAEYVGENADGDLVFGVWPGEGSADA
jgi:uncharacterized YigZ family protein